MGKNMGTLPQETLRENIRKNTLQYAQDPNIAQELIDVLGANNSLLNMPKQKFSKRDYNTGNTLRQLLQNHNIDFHEYADNLAFAKTKETQEEFFYKYNLINKFIPAIVKNIAVLCEDDHLDSYEKEEFLKRLEKFREYSILQKHFENAAEKVYRDEIASNTPIMNEATE